MQNIKREKIIEIVWFVVVLSLFIISIKMLRSGTLQTEVAAFGVWAPLLVLVLKMTTLVVAPLGGTPLYVLAGGVFGTKVGFLICFLGDILGSSVCFWLSRRYGVKVLSIFAGSQNVDKVLKTVSIINNTSSFVKARVGFASMPELLAYAAGLSRLNFWRFSFINALFYLPVDIALVFFGSQIATLGAKYLFILPVLIFIVTVSGFTLLYKDYQKTETM